MTASASRPLAYEVLVQEGTPGPAASGCPTVKGSSPRP